MIPACQLVLEVLELLCPLGLLVGPSGGNIDVTIGFWKSSTTLPNIFNFLLIGLDAIWRESTFCPLEPRRPLVPGGPPCPGAPCRQNMTELENNKCPCILELKDSSSN